MRCRVDDHNVLLILVDLVGSLALTLQFVLGGLGLSTADHRRDDAQSALAGGRHQPDVDHRLVGTLLERLAVDGLAKQAESQ